MNLRNNVALPILLVSLASALVAQPRPPGWPLGARIPEISGQVVDALTGRPLSGVDVTLRATALTGAFFGGGSSALRYENSRTSASGEFTFRASVEREAAGFLTSMEGYWLTVNIAFHSLESLKKEEPDSDPHMDMLGRDLSYEVANLPFDRPAYPHRASTHRTWNRPAYFPLSVEFVHPCQQAWSVNCMHFDETHNLRIPLIPILDDPTECKRIADPAVAEQCRQVNTYQAAFHDVDTIAGVQAGKEVCAQIDHAIGTRTCLQNLASIAPQMFAGRPDPLAEYKAALVLVPDPVLRTGNPSWGRSNRCTWFSVSYWRDFNSAKTSDAVVYRPATPEGFDAILRTVRGGASGGLEGAETIAGHVIRQIENSDRYLYFWRTSSAVIALTFYKPARSPGRFSEQQSRAAAATPEMRRELIRRY